MGSPVHAECYIQDLDFKNQLELLDEQSSSNKLSLTMEVQYGLAKQLGFSDPWFLQIKYSI
jgi:hypothetical protein